MNIFTKSKKIKIENGEPKRFAEGICFSKLFWVFVVGCIFGTLYEEVLHLIYFGVWSTRQGLVWGPFNPVYGIGMVLMVGLLHKKNVWQTIIYGALCGGAVEYFLNFFEELVIGSRSWNYVDQFLNLNGRTTIPYMLFWGLLAVLACKIVYPGLSYLIERVPISVGKSLTVIFVIFFIWNIIFTGLVFVRQALREQDIKPWTPLGEWLDEYYNDEKIAELFPNLNKDFDKDKQAEAEQHAKAEQSSQRNSYVFVLNENVKVSFDSLVLKAA